MCVVSSAEGASFGAAAVQRGGGGGGGGGSVSNSVIYSSHRLTTSDQKVFLPPSDAAISSSIDRPQVGAEGSCIESGVDAADARGKEGVRVEAGSGGMGAGKVTLDQLVARKGKAVCRGAMPRGETRRRRDAGRGQRGWMVPCGVQDADIASGLTRRGRLGDPSLGIVGTRSSITLEPQ